MAISPSPPALRPEILDNQFRLFFGAIWEPEDMVEIRAIWPDRSGPKPKSEWLPAGEWASGARREWLETLNATGWNLYAGVLPRAAAGARGNDNTLPGRVVWADIDHVSPADATQRLAAGPMPAPSVVVNTGHGVQCYWLLNGKREPAALRRLVADLAAAIGSDASVQNEERVLRIPGFINHKPPVAESELLVCDATLRYSFDDLRARIPRAPASSVPAATAVVPPAWEDDIVERARRYLAMIPGSGPGGRTNTAFRAAATLYGPGELARILVNAEKYGKHSRGALLEQPASGVSFDMEEFIANTTGRAMETDLSDNRKERIPNPGLLPEHLLHVPGFMGELTKYIDDKNHKSQPAAALGAALVAMGTLTGRKVEGVTGCRTNFYVLNVIESGEGKNAPREVLTQLLYDPDNMFYYAVDRLKSDAGIRAALEVNPCAVFILDEIGEFLETIRYARNSFWIRNIIPELMSLYSSAATPHVMLGGYADVSKNLDVNCPHVCLYGTSVSRSVFQSMTMNSVTSGFIGRLLIFEGAAENPRKKRASRLPIPPSIIEMAKWWREFAPNGMLTGTHAGSISSPILVDESAEATAIFDECENAAREDIDKYGREWGGPYNRVEENARKLAIAYACSECNNRPFIGISAAQWGSDLSLYLTRRLVYLASINVADNETHDKKNRVLRMILNAGTKGIRHSDLMSKCRFLKGSEFRDILDSLIMAESIRGEERKTNTKKIRVYYPPDS